MVGPSVLKATPGSKGSPLVECNALRYHTVSDSICKGISVLSLCFPDAMRSEWQLHMQNEVWFTLQPSLFPMRLSFPQVRALSVANIPGTSFVNRKCHGWPTSRRFSLSACGCLYVMSVRVVYAFMYIVTAACFCFYVCSSVSIYEHT